MPLSKPLPRVTKGLLHEGNNTIMHSIDFIHDLAVIMLIAGVVTVVFHRLKQPVVLGYIVAGVIIGPHTPPSPLITDQHTIDILAELGVIFLMFSLGLEFSLRKLRAVGATVAVAGLAEIVLMIWIGFEIGRHFGWKTMDALFLGAMMAISSTTIIVRALDELGLKREGFAQIIFGILVVEDILAICMMVLLTGLAVSGNVSPQEVAFTFGKLTIFLVVSLVAGLLVVPRLLDYVARAKSNEMLLVSVLGICFGFCLLVMRMGYSVAMGAFVIGAVMAEARALRNIERLIEPVRDMFSAIFFVTIGLMLDPRVLGDYLGPIVVVSIAVIVGKIVAVSVGSFIAGQEGRTSMRIGMSMAQIGEFSFIIATLGISLRVTSDFLYPVAVAVSVITTVLTPLLIRSADPLTKVLARAMPRRLSRVFRFYTGWLQSLRLEGDQAVIASMVRKILMQVFVNLCIVVALFLVSAYLVRDARIFAGWVSDSGIQKALGWGGALLLSIPFLIAAYRKLKALSMMLAEVGVRRSFAGRHTDSVRRVVAEIIPVLSLAVMLVLLSALSSSILPPAEMLVLVLVVGALVVVLLWRQFIKLHSRLQIALIDTFQKPPAEY